MSDNWEYCVTPNGDLDCAPCPHCGTKEGFNVGVSTGMKFAPGYDKDEPLVPVSAPNVTGLYYAECDYCGEVLISRD